MNKEAQELRPDESGSGGPRVRLSVGERTARAHVTEVVRELRSDAPSVWTSGC